MPELEDPTEHSPDDVVVYDDVPERRLDPRTARILAVLGGVVAVCLTVVAIAYVVRPRSTYTGAAATAAARTWIARNCNGRSCIAGSPKQKADGIYTVRVTGDETRCLLVDLPAFNRSGSSPSGVFPTTCNNLGLRHPWLTVALAKPNSPLVTGPLSDPTGFEPALLREIADRIGANGVHWVAATPAQLRRPGPKPFDLVAGGIIVTQLKNPQLQPTSLYATLSRALIARSHALAKHLHDDPSGMLSLTVGVIGHPDRLPQRARLIRYADEQAGLRALASGTIDVLAVDQPDIKRILAAHPSFALAGVIRSSRGLGFGVAGNGALGAAVSMAVTELASSGDVLKLFLSWYPALRNVEVFPSAPPGQTP